MPVTWSAVILFPISLEDENESASSSSSLSIPPSHLPSSSVSTVSTFFLLDSSAFVLTAGCSAVAIMMMIALDFDI